MHSCTVEWIGMLEMPDIQGRSCGHETPAKKAEPEINTIPRKDNTIPQRDDTIAQEGEYNTKKGDREDEVEPEIELQSGQVSCQLTHRAHFSQVVKV